MRVDNLSPLPADTKVFSEQGLSGTRSRANQNLGLHNFEFRIEPWPAGLNFRISRLFMDALFAPLRKRPFEVFDHVGDINIFSIDSGFCQRVSENPASGPDKGMSFTIFGISRLLPDHHVNGARLSFAQHCLRGIFPKVARLAHSSGLPDLREGGTRSAPPIDTRMGMGMICGTNHPSVRAAR
jgi:hypothetical protein